MHSIRHSDRGAAFVLIGAQGPGIAHPCRTVEHRLMADVELRATVVRHALGAPQAVGLIMDGSATFGAIAAQVSFRNDPRGLHPYLEAGAAEAVLIEPSFTLPLKRSRVLAPARGDALVALRWFDSDFVPLGLETVLGRLSAAPFQTTLSTRLPMAVSFSVTAIDSGDEGGPTLELSGHWALEKGILAALGFQGEGRRGTPQPEDAAHLVLPVGSGQTLPERPARGGVGGYPMISVQFRTGVGAPISPEYVLGRCVSLDRESA